MGTCISNWRSALSTRLSAIALGIAGALLGCPATPVQADPAMWVVKDADTTVYLLGTIHVLKSDTKWRNEKLETAFKQSDQYWMEADIQQDPAIAQTYVLNFGMDSQHSLKDRLSAADYAKLLQATAAMKLPEDRVVHMRPWLAYILLSEGAVASSGYDPRFGVDQSLANDATSTGKPIMALETTDHHLGILSGMPKPVELELLVQALAELSTGDGKDSDRIDAMKDAWLAGDTKALYNTGMKEMRAKAPEFFDILITKRNAAWIPKIEGMMQAPGTYFIAVGAGHLIGEGGLPALLSKRGYKVARY